MRHLDQLLVHTARATASLRSLLNPLTDSQKAVTLQHSITIRSITEGAPVSDGANHAQSFCNLLQRSVSEDDALNGILHSGCAAAPVSKQDEEGCRLSHDVTQLHRLVSLIAPVAIRFRASAIAAIHEAP